MTRIIDFNDGYTSSTEPSTGGALASFVESFANDGAYEAIYGVAPYTGKAGFYFNTTLNKLRIHDGTEWRTNERALDNATASDPTINDDSDDGYETLSLWLNTSSGALFRATDVTVGSAVWQEIAMDAVLDAHINDLAIHVDWSQSGAGTIHASNYVDSDTVYSHPNHTGDVTSTGDGATVIASSAISGKTLKSTLAGTEEFLLNDAGTIKKTTAQDIADLGGGGSIQIAVLQEESNSGLASSANTVQTRNLNSSYGDTGIITSLSSSQFVIEAGEYHAEYIAFSYRSAYSTLFLYNVTDSAYVSTVQPNTYNWPSTNIFITTHGRDRFTIASQKTFELRHYTNAGDASGLGNSGYLSTNNPASTNVYAQLTLMKLD